MRIGDKTPAPLAELFDADGKKVGETSVELAPPVGSPHRSVADAGSDMVTLGEDLYGILCELIDSVPLETAMQIGMAFQSKPHPTFSELTDETRAAFEAGAAAFDDEGDDDDDEDNDDEEIGE